MLADVCSSVSVSRSAPHRLVRIISGGQTGADRAALDAAIAHGIPYGGWCPVGGWAEDLPDPPGLLSAYPDLQEATTPDDRTVRNVRDSHATLIVCGGGAVTPGTDLTVRTAEALRRPLMLSDGDPERLTRWLSTLGDSLGLNVAGPRESEQPGVYDRTRRLLDEVLG